MEELTIEQKAKAYDEAIERAKKWRNAPNADKIPTFANRVIDEIFPELKESEDERIRKWLIDFVEGIPEDGLDFKYAGIQQKDVLAWLEKQGTSYTKRDVDDAYVEGMAYAKDELEKQGEQKPTDEEMKELLQTEYEKGRADAIAEMQNPAWSEVDEKCLENAIMYCEWARDKAPDLYCYETSEKSINWLKSLKRRIGGV